MRLLRTLPPFERGIVCAGRQAAGKPITTAWLRQRFNLSKAQAKRDMDKVADELKSARGVYRSALKAAKKIGVNQAMLIQAMQIVTVQDEAEVTMDFRDLGRYLRYLNSPIGAQFGLFDDGQVEVSADARAQHDAGGEQSSRR